MASTNPETSSVLGKQNLKNLSDNDVVQLYLDTQGETYFSLIYSRFINKIFSKCISLLKDEALAKDATQDIFLKIFLNLAKFNRKSKFSTWVYSITYNYCIDLLRKRNKEKTLFSGEVEAEGEVVEEVSDKELLELEIDRIKVVLDQMPVGDKMVLLMKYKDDMTIKEISEIFGKSESAIKMKIKRAKQKARETYKNNYTVNH